MSFLFFFFLKPDLQNLTSYAEVINCSNCQFKEKYGFQGWSAAWGVNTTLTSSAMDTKSLTHVTSCSNLFYVLHQHEALVGFKWFPMIQEDC